MSLVCSNINFHVIFLYIKIEFTLKLNITAYFNIKHNINCPVPPTTLSCIVPVILYVLQICNLFELALSLVVADWVGNGLVNTTRLRQPILALGIYHKGFPIDDMLKYWGTKKADCLKKSAEKNKCSSLDTVTCLNSSVIKLMKLDLLFFLIKL